MPEIQMSLVASPAVIADLTAVARHRDVLISESVAAESPADALDAPIGAVEVKEILEMVVVVVQFGTAALTFTKALLEVLRERNESVVVKSASTGKEIGVLSATSSIEAATALMNACSR